MTFGMMFGMTFGTRSQGAIKEQSNAVPDRERDSRLVRQLFPRAAKNVVLPNGFRDLNWSVLEFLGWRDPKSPGKAYIVLIKDARPVGIMLRAPGSSAGRPGTGLCHFCHSARPADDIQLFAVARAGAAGRHGNTIGTYMCADLACSLYVHGVLKLVGPQPEKLPSDERAILLQSRLAAFVDHVLDPTLEAAASCAGSRRLPTTRPRVLEYRCRTESCRSPR